MPELRGDVAVHGFWSRGMMAVFDIRVTDTDSNSYRNTDPAKVLKKHETEKKNKYGEACRQAHMHFTPLVFSVDGMEGGELTAARKRLASRLAAKWRRKYSQVCGFICSRLAFTLVRSASRCLRELGRTFRGQRALTGHSRQVCACILNSFTERQRGLTQIETGWMKLDATQTQNTHEVTFEQQDKYRQ